MQQLEHELTQTQTNLDQATHNLEEKEKALQNVSLMTNNFLSYNAWKLQLSKQTHPNDSFVKLR